MTRMKNGAKQGLDAPGITRFCSSRKDSSFSIAYEGRRPTSSEGHRVAVPSSARTLTFKPGEGAFYPFPPYRSLLN